MRRNADPEAGSPGPRKRCCELLTLVEQRGVVRAELINIGCVPHRVGSDFLPVLVEKLDPAYVNFVARIKTMLDPNGIMNPGVVVG
ncbi:MAG: hypothetical protein KGZ79_03315 [Dethiobacter sp.]|jgi:hypothetical protein|nr:hypothetical protein [Dethiobacter sp.]